MNAHQYRRFNRRPATTALRLLQADVGRLTVRIVSSEKRYRSLNIRMHAWSTKLAVRCLPDSGDSGRAVTMAMHDGRLRGGAAAAPV